MSNDNIEDTLNSLATDGSEETETVEASAPSGRKSNEVFKEQAGAIPPVRSMTRDEYARQELGFDIPVDSVPLPSGGLVYPPSHPLHQAPSVEFRSMTAREEDILMSRALIKKGTVITELIKSCLVNKTINVNTLLSGDRNAIMIAIRASGYGREYTPTFECPRCEIQTEFPIDLHDLDIKPLEIRPIIPFDNVFEFKLPVSKKLVHFRFLTGAEEEKALKDMELKKKKGLGNNQLVTTRLASTIVSVDGQTDFATISKFVHYMPAMDSRALRKYIDDNEPGVNMEVEFECQNPDCEYVDKIHLPMDKEFFWPGS